MRLGRTGGLAVSILLALFAGSSPRAELTLLGQFPSGLASPVGCGFDPTTDRVWVYAEFSSSLSGFSRSGTLLGTIPRPGEAADDCDITVASSGLTLGAIQLSAGTLLCVNGESGVADIYALDKLTGTATATLPAAFGASHVVGGSYHPARDAFFLVQDRQPTGSTNDNLLAEIQPSTGSVLGSFATTTAAASFTVNFGDVEVGANGNLFVVSSDESAILELTPTGALVQQMTLPIGVSSLSGLGIDHSRGEGWVSGTGGTVWRLGGFPVAGPADRPSLIVSKDLSGVAVLDWTSIAGATGYDVVRGDLGILRQPGEGFASATTGCLRNDAAVAPIADPDPLPPEGARWYLVRAFGAGGVGTYNGDSPRQVGSRDPGIAASGLGCP